MKTKIRISNFGRQAVAAMREAVMAEAREYQRYGLKMAIERNGRVIQIAPSEVLKLGKNSKR